jgi:16S rRNA (cytosine1402-N4)-methyltransferase
MVYHIPVLLNEVMEGLAVQPGGRYVDCTLGGAGHTAAILGHSSPGGQLLGIDADASAVAAARTVLADYAGSVSPVHYNSVNLGKIAKRLNFYPVHGVLFDLGISSIQLGTPERGFSFQIESPLDMRFDVSHGETAADLVNTLTESDLARLIFEYGEERQSRQIARQIVGYRPVTSTTQLASIVEHAVGGRHGKIHPATRTFQALRIAVNHELDNLKAALSQSIDLLGFEGRLAVITYHSLEDRIVKQFLAEESRDCICPPETPVCTCSHKARIKLINKKVITPSQAEINRNPRARSAKLRIAERLLKNNQKFIAIGSRRFLMEEDKNEFSRPVKSRLVRKEALVM